MNIQTIIQAIDNYTVREQGGYLQISGWVFLHDIVLVQNTRRGRRLHVLPM